MATFGYNALTKELCKHVGDVLAEALNGSDESERTAARRWLMGGFGQSHGLFLQEFWTDQDAKADVFPVSNTDRLRQRRQRLGEQAQATMQQLGRLQAEARDIDELLHQQSIQPLADEIIARRAQWEHQQAAQEKAAIAERYAAQQAAELERHQNADDYAKRVAQQHQEREQKERENAARRAKELAPFMP